LKVVTGSADAWPDQHVVDVRFEVAAGPKSLFGGIRIEGLEGVPAELVARRVTFEAGDPFDPKDLAETRAALFGLQVFSMVNVTPDLSAPDSATVPILIELRGTKTRRLKLGPGIEVEAGKAAVYAAAEWQDHNLFGRLWNFEQSVQAGAAGVLAQKRLWDGFDLDQLTIAPIVNAKTSLMIPDVPGPDWALELDARVQYDIEPGYRYFSPEIAPAIAWTHWDHLKVSGGYRVKFFDYLDFTIDVQDIADSPLGLDLTDPFLLSMLEQHVIWDGRDNPIDPRRGWYASLNLAEAGGPVFGNFNFFRAAGEVRAYREVPRLLGWNPKLVVAARVGGGGIAPYGTGDKASVPYAERLHLGGGTSVRGWGANRLGPRMVVTSLDGSGDEVVPTGGLLDVFGNLELRKLVGLGISVAAFTDVGQVWSRPKDLSFDTLQWTVGGGLRYATAIGPIRADIGVRLGPDHNQSAAEQTGQPRWTLHFGLAEAF
jgi:translocation and assembly module TamA